MTPASPPPSCAHCGEPLGVYEPGITILGDGRLLETSHDLRRTLPDAVHYHLACAPDDRRL